MMTTDAPRSDRDDDATADSTPPAPLTSPVATTPDESPAEAAAAHPGAVPDIAASDGGVSDGEPAGAPGTHVSVSQDAVAEMPNEPPATATAPPSATFDTPNTHAGEAPPLAEHAATVQEPATGIPETVNAPSEANQTQAPATAAVTDAEPGQDPPSDDGDAKASARERMQQGGNDAAAAKPIPTQTTSGPAPVAAVEVPKGDDPLDPELEAQITQELSGSMVEPPPAPQPTSDGAEVGAASTVAAVSTLDAGDIAAPGQQVEGTVTTIHGDSIFVDFGGRHSGQVPTRQFGADDLPKVGDKLQVVVQSVDNENGVIVCSRPGSRTSAKRANWDEVAVDQIVDARVTKRNKGGLEVTVGSLRGFMPASQVDAGYVPDLDQFVGQTLQARVLEVNPAKRKLVVSRKSLQMDARRESEKQLFGSIAKGDRLTGTVKSLKDFGAFIDLGGVDGLLHIGQISWSRIGHPSEVLEVGQEIEVAVKEVDTEKKKISLSLRDLASNPWMLAEQKYAVGSTVSGKVTRVADFGAFVMIEPGIEGLVHISQIDHRRVRRVEDELSVGQQIEAKVLEVDPGRKRISLSLKALKESPEQFDAPQEEQRPRRPRRKDLRGGSSTGAKGGLFGNPDDFS